MSSKVDHPVACISTRHYGTVTATVLMHWVTGPVYYCDECAVQMRVVADALAVHVAEVRIEPPDLEDGRARRLRVE